MNDKEEKELISSAKKSVINAIIGVVISGIVAFTVFYFSTKYTVAQNTSGIKELNQEVKKITTVPQLNQEQIKFIQKELAEFKQQYKENHKEDKAAIDDLRKQNQKMIELLYQIKNSN